MPPPKSKKKLAIICGVLIAVFLIVEFTGIRSYLSPEKIKELFDQHQIAGVFFFCLAFSLGNLLYVPGWVFLAGAVFALDKELGGVVTYTAALCSSTVSFFLINSIGGDALRSLDSKLADKIFEKLDNHPVLSVAALRLIFQTVPALNYALALAKVRFSRYFIGTAIGLPLPIFIYCYFFEIIFKHLLKH